MESINIVLTKETIEAGFQKHLDDLFTKDNYNHPIKKILDTLFGTYQNDSPETRDILKAMVIKAAQTKMDTPEFQLMVQQAIANEVAKKAVEHMKNEKKSPW